MSFSFSSLVRLIVLLALGSTMLAVGVAKLEPPAARWRARRPATHIHINEYFLGSKDGAARWLDLETGGVAPFAPAGGDDLDEATCSPWVDPRGRRQAVGRWTSRTQDGPSSTSSDFGLARYSFPDGAIIDRVSTDIVPVGPPCWFPGTRARVLFAAGDGRLYRHEFEPEPGADPRPEPRPLTWRCRKPGVGEVFLNDLSWPEDPRLGGCVLVALRDQRGGEEGLRHYSRTQLWWLRLDHAGTEVVEAGPLIDHDLGGEAWRGFDERSPVISTLPDGRLALAYLRQRGGDSGWELRTAPIRIEGDRRAPTARESGGRVLSDHAQPAHPAFSTDGRWLYAIVGPSPREGRVARLPINDASLASTRP